MPKLRKNRRIETRWGVKYHTAVRNAVFITGAPYVPIEPPSSMKEYASEFGSLYTCVQCKDSFHFRSSLEDHIARKSWILGYWCQQCFTTVCKHSAVEGSMCSTCMQLDREKRLYLRSRGVRKSQKFGAVRIFYNQCQFFAHLKTHDVNVVHMGDLMLMPLPTNLNNNWNPEVDIICEALMEHTFIIKVHIMDWLKDKCIDKSWWQVTMGVPEESKNPAALILKGYKGQLYFKPLEIPVVEQFIVSSSPYSTSKKNSAYSDIEISGALEAIDRMTCSSSIETANSVSEESVIENEDSPCTINDIAFVDCGSTSKCFEPEVPLHSNSERQKRASVKAVHNSAFTPQSSNTLVNEVKKNGSTQLNCVPPDIIMSYGSTMITQKQDIKNGVKGSADTQLQRKPEHRSNINTTPIKVVTEGNIINVDSPKKINRTGMNNLLIIEPLSKVQSDKACVTKVDTSKNKVGKLKQSVHSLTVNSGQKFVTFQSAKRVDINTIINQLPAHIINKKKIVFVGQTSDAATFHSKQESSSKTVVHLVPDESEKLVEKRKNLENEASSQSNKDFSRTISKNETETGKNKERLVSNKVVYKNGRRYVIKLASGSAKNSKSKMNAITPIKDKQASVQSKSTNSIPALIPLSSTDIENISHQERPNSFHGDVSPLTPSPSPSELSSSSSCDVQSRQSFSSLRSSQKSDASYLIATEHRDVGISMQNMNNLDESLSFHKGEDQNLYLDVKFLTQKPIYTIVDTPTMVTKCREEMLNEFFHLSYAELKKRYEHLQQTGEEISRVMDFVTDNVINENLKAVNILQTVLKHCIDKCSERIDDIDEEGTDEIDAPLNDWESEFQRMDEKSICKACNKVTKPKYYVPGFSKATKNDIYCSCYRHVCHKCDTYQGNSTRFVAHQTFHDKEKPYLCPDCYRKFTAFKSLEVHTWTTCFHTLKKRVLGCKICEIDGFPDMESVSRHFAIMHSHKKIACDKCYIVLPSYSDYRKHHNERHLHAEQQHPIRLALCKLGRCIVRCEDYMLHMEKHSVVQRLIWFKCPFCSFIHVEAKRIMAHLQSVHIARLKELISSDVLWNVLQIENAAKLLKSSSQQTKFTNAQTGSCEDGTVMPKIISARTITSEVFERGAQVTEDYLISDDIPEYSKVDQIRGKSCLKSSNSTPKILDVRSMAALTLNDSKCARNEVKGKFVKEREDSKGNAVVKRTKGTRAIPVEEAAAMSKMKSKYRGNDLWKKKMIDLESDTLSVGSSQSASPRKSNDDQDERETLKPELSLEDEALETTEGGQITGISNNMQNRKSAEGMKLNRASIWKPPPLSRIPGHTLELNRSKKIGQSMKMGKMVASSSDEKIRCELPRRIALNGPTSSPETVNFSCPLCEELINTSTSVVYDHYQSNHSQSCKLSIVTINLQRISSGFINGGYKELLSNKKRKPDNNASGSKRRRRWTPKKYTDGKSGSFAGIGLCVEQETAKDSEGNFRCKKCEQRCSDMANLREHIASYHRIRGRYLVCLECGDNFVVAPSLQMHLKAFHGIEDPITYMAQNTSYAPDTVDDLETGGKSIEANQCHVCMAVFEDKAAVDKHLRVHGMAFLNRKRIEAQNALKCPEKRSEDAEEEKQTPFPIRPKELVRKDKPAETILEKISATI